MTDPNAVVLHCDSPSCEHSIELPPGTTRYDRHWGRVTVYTLTGASDYDLCADHYSALLDTLCNVAPTT